MSTPPTSRTLVTIIAAALLITACSSESEPSETVDADASTSTGATSTPGDTDEIDEPATTVEPGDPEAVARARTRVEAAAAALPDDFETGIEEGEPATPATGGSNDLIFGPCIEEGEFDMDNLSGVTAGVVTLAGQGAPAEGGLPGPSVTIEVRVIDSEDEAEAAFMVLERIFGTDGGRQCLADAVGETMGPQIEDADLDLTVDGHQVDGTDVGARVTMTFEVAGEGTEVTIDLLATREGDLTVYGSFLGFTEPVPTDLQSASMSG